MNIALWPIGKAPKKSIQMWADFCGIQLESVYFSAARYVINIIFAVLWYFCDVVGEKVRECETFFIHVKILFLETVTPYFHLCRPDRASRYSAAGPPPGDKSRRQHD